MSAEDETLTAVDAIRCVYLARMARRQGNQPAPLRWQAKVDRWLARQAGRRSPPLRRPPAPDPKSLDIEGAAKQ